MVLKLNESIYSLKKHTIMFIGRIIFSVKNNINLNKTILYLKLYKKAVFLERNAKKLFFNTKISMDVFDCIFYIQKGRLIVLCKLKQRIQIV